MGNKINITKSMGHELNNTEQWEIRNNKIWDRPVCLDVLITNYQMIASLFVLL